MLQNREHFITVLNLSNGCMLYPKKQKHFLEGKTPRFISLRYLAQGKEHTKCPIKHLIIVLEQKEKVSIKWHRYA